MRGKFLRSFNKVLYLIRWAAQWSWDWIYAFCKSGVERKAMQITQKIALDYQVPIFFFFSAFHEVSVYPQKELPFFIHFTAGLCSFSAMLALLTHQFPELMVVFAKAVSMVSVITVLTTFPTSLSFKNQRRCFSYSRCLLCFVTV